MCELILYFVLIINLNVKVSTNESSVDNVPILLELLDSFKNQELPVCSNSTFDVSNDQDIEQNISDISINLTEANSSTPKVQFNIGDSANHPKATVTPLESEVDSGFISSEAVNVPELSKGLIDVINTVKFVDDDEVEEVSKIFFNY